MGSRLVLCSQIILKERRKEELLTCTSTANISILILTNLYDIPEPSWTSRMCFKSMCIFQCSPDSIIKCPTRRIRSASCSFAHPRLLYRYRSVDSMLPEVGTYYLPVPVFIVTRHWRLFPACSTEFQGRLLCSSVQDLFYIIMPVVVAQQLVPHVANGLDSYLFIFPRGNTA